MPRRWRRWVRVVRSQVGAITRSAGAFQGCLKRRGGGLSALDPPPRPATRPRAALPMPSLPPPTAPPCRSSGPRRYCPGSGAARAPGWQIDAPKPIRASTHHAREALLFAGPARRDSPGTTARRRGSRHSHGPSAAPVRWATPRRRCRGATRSICYGGWRRPARLHRRRVRIPARELGSSSGAPLWGPWTGWGQESCDDIAAKVSLQLTSNTLPLVHGSKNGELADGNSSCWKLNHCCETDWLRVKFALRCDCGLAG